MAGRAAEPPVAAQPQPVEFLLAGDARVHAAPADLFEQPRRQRLGAHGAVRGAGFEVPAGRQVQVGGRSVVEGGLNELLNALGRPVVGLGVRTAGQSTFELALGLEHPGQQMVGHGGGTGQCVGEGAAVVTAEQGGLRLQHPQVHVVAAGGQHLLQH